MKEILKEIWRTARAHFYPTDPVSQVQLISRGGQKKYQTAIAFYQTELSTPTLYSPVPYIFFLLSSPFPCLHVLGPTLRFLCSTFRQALVHFNRHI